LSDNSFPRLCGGVFLNVLSENKKQRTSARESYNGTSDGLSDYKMLEKLILIFMPIFTPPNNR